MDLFGLKIGMLKMLVTGVMLVVAAASGMGSCNQFLVHIECHCALALA